MPGPPIGTPNEWHTSRSACPQRIPVHTTGGRTYQHTKREVLIGDPLPAPSAQVKNPQMRYGDQASGLRQRRPGNRAKSVSFEYMSALYSNANAAN